jgi:hypothetical protein
LSSYTRALEGPRVITQALRPPSYGRATDAGKLRLRSTDPARNPAREKIIPRVGRRTNGPFAFRNGPTNPLLIIVRLRRTRPRSSGRPGGREEEKASVRRRWKGTVVENEDPGNLREWHAYLVVFARRKLHHGNEQVPEAISVALSYDVCTDFCSRSYMCSQSLCGAFKFILDIVFPRIDISSRMLITGNLLRSVTTRPFNITSSFHQFPSHKILNYYF